LFALTACAPNATPVDAGAGTVSPGTIGIPEEPADTTLPAGSGASTTVLKVPLARTLKKGDTGDDVRQMQQRLRDLAFDPGKLDGIYGESTAEAVWAYKALILGERWDKDLSSKVTPDAWDRMQDPLGWTPRKEGATPRHVEVLLPEQVAVVVNDGQIRLITHVSTGSRKHWCLKRRPPPKSPDDTSAAASAAPTAAPTAASSAVAPTAMPAASSAVAPGVAPAEYCGDSITPGGSYKIWAKRTGIFQGYYGDLYNATFFNGGLAIHGFDSVPYYPDSHGCVRIPNHIADYFQSLVRVGDQVFVFDGETDPEVLGAVPPPDDVAATTTSSTSTTAKPTTTNRAAATTKAPATTTPAKVTSTAEPAAPPATTSAVAAPVPHPSPPAGPTTTAGR
jgi:L,D-transpeptidase catalytic domain/Putative peptidoglycan binding domain